MPETIEQKCISKGVKLTEQRKIIAKILSESKEEYGSKDHPDVDELHKRVNKLDSKTKLLDTKFKNYVEKIISIKEIKLNTLCQLLEASSFKRVLDRGFSLVMDDEGKPIKLSSEAPQNATVKIKFSDKTRTATLDS